MAPKTGSRQAYSLAALAVLLVVVVVVVWLWVRGDDRTRVNSAVSPPDSAPAAAEPGPLSAAAPAVPPSDTFPYPPLWPFVDEAAASAWEVAYGEGGLQPWHLDPGQTALYFASYYLGYANIDKVVSSSVRGAEAWVGVGFERPGGGLATAAVVHLVRFGPPPDAPWEVVGTQDTTLSVTAPAYGARVTSPLTVGGLVTGVDESLRVQVRAIPAPEPLGVSEPIPAGGTDSPWSTTVALRDGCVGALTVAVATGGHVAEVERFAVTGVRC
ncbi:hypothetical protein NDR87_15985 [Nocardia sp. CDC159]|uniref:Uncharacterized protein n=1 Tax=Nocardia pulmonis TaxID=2951408 RepID=A0A9X2IZW8_9NOCA|nr:MULTISPECIES: hypothetical protein [Nocardia]MCM6775406.1 hypothetical protein [Nocardia pulmonis]MCM6787860.1 hypothetical protein [Nocardia sp. CDC159]